MSYLCDPFFIFSLIFIIINHTISLKETQLIFAHFLEYITLVLDGNMSLSKIDHSYSYAQHFP